MHEAIEISYTVWVDDEFRRALAFRFGWTEPASNEQIKRHYQQEGEQNDHDIVMEFRKRHS